MYHRFVLGASLPTMLKNAAPYTSRGWSLVWTPTLERQPSRFWPLFETGHANSHDSAVLQRGAVEDLIQTFQTCIPDALAIKPSVMSAWDTFRLVHASRDRLRELWMDAEDISVVSPVMARGGNRRSVIGFADSTIVEERGVYVYGIPYI